MLPFEAWRYRALRGDGTIEEGFLERTGRSEAVSALRSRGLLPISVEQSDDQRPRGRRLSAGDAALGLRTLAVLLDSGLSLSRALAAFEETAPPGWKRSAGTVRERVRQGEALGLALDRSNVGLAPLLLGVIKAGEGGSGLAQAVRRAAELAESTAELRASIRSALAYPTLLAVIGACSIAIIVGVVLPRFAGIIAGIGGNVPALARWIMDAGRFVRRAALPGAIVLVGAVFLWRVWSADKAAAVRIHRVLLRLPLIGPMRLEAASSRLCSALAALLDAGVPVAIGLAHAAGATGDQEIERRSIDAREQIIGGTRLSAALDGTRAVTPTAARLIRAGEESGQLAQMLERAALLDMNRLGESLKALVRIIEPALIVAFASIIAVVCGALLQTVYAVKPS